MNDDGEYVVSPEVSVTLLAVTTGEELATSGAWYGFTSAFASVTVRPVLALAVLPVPKDEVRIRLRVQAHVLKETGDGLAAGVGACAEHNGVVRWGVEKLTKGGGAWVFPAALAIAPFAVQTAAVWKAPLEGDMRMAADRIEEEALAEFRASMGMDGEAPGPEPEPAAA